MKERPILFSSPMVLALLAGTKTQTRRIVKPLPNGLRPNCYVARNGERWVFTGGDRNGDMHGVLCPYGEAGDRLWVRETLREENDGWTYAADGASIELPKNDPRVPAMVSWAHHKEGSTCVSIHMPRWASRIDLEIVEVRVQRLRDLEAAPDLGEADVLAEGLSFVEDMPGAGLPRQYGLPGRMVSRTPWGAFQKLWDEINGERAPWDSNPFVWAVTFRRIRP